MVYFISDGTDLKIGFTDRPIEQRLAELQTGNPQVLQVVATIPGGDLWTESRIHRNWEADRLRKNGEWFTDSAAMRQRIQNLCASFEQVLF